MGQAHSGSRVHLQMVMSLDHHSCWLTIRHQRKLQNCPWVPPPALPPEKREAGRAWTPLDHLGRLPLQGFSSVWTEGDNDTGGKAEAWEVEGPEGAVDMRFGAWLAWAPLAALPVGGCVPWEVTSPLEPSVASSVM